MDDIWHEATLGRERELELRQRWLERQRELRRESERVERWQSGRFSKLFNFLLLTSGSFYLIFPFSILLILGRYLQVSQEIRNIVRSS